MSEFQQINAKISAIDARLEKHEGKIELVLGDISESLKKISEVMIKQEIQEKALEENHEDIKTLQENYHGLDKELSLARQSEDNIAKTADEIKSSLKSALRWGAGIFGSLIIVLVVAFIKSLATS